MITENIKYVGVNDHSIDLFEGQYIVPNGMAYNSYVIDDEKIAVFAQGDSVPIEIYDVYITTLPEKDQKSLRKGISAKGRTELRILIEDYTS